MREPSALERREQAEATLFAFELLLPEEPVRAAARGLDLFDEGRVAALAKDWKTSPALMWFRLGMLYERGGHR
jgi:Zn-dependent peptidase ImmA (M78 family)